MLLPKIKKLLSVFIITFPMLILIITGFQQLPGSAYSETSDIKNLQNSSTLTMQEFLQEDMVLNLLGKSFTEIRELLGEPQEEGYSSWNGPHNYMNYQFENRTIRLCSPLDTAENIVVSIFIEGEQEVLGAKVGMHFSQIRNIWGDPDYGPGPGIGNYYYMDYYFGETVNQTPEIFISFSANSIDSPTIDLFIKWEAYENEYLANSTQYEL